MPIFCLNQFSSVAQLCLTLCDPMSHSTPGLPVHHQPGCALESSSSNFLKIHIFLSLPSNQHTELAQPAIPELMFAAAAAAAKSLQSCPTLCDPIDGSPPGSPVPGILQARTLEVLPFPSPVHESEKWKCSRSVVSDSSQPHGLQPTRLLCPWDFPGKSTGVGCHRLLRNSCLGAS